MSRGQFRSCLNLVFLESSMINYECSSALRRTVLLKSSLPERANRREGLRKYYFGWKSHLIPSRCFPRRCPRPCRCWKFFTSVNPPKNTSCARRLLRQGGATSEQTSVQRILPDPRERWPTRTIETNRASTRPKAASGMARMS